MRRIAPIVLTVVLAVAGTVGLIAFFQSRDQATVKAGEGGRDAPGVAAPEENDPRLAAGNVILTYRRAEDGAVLKALAEDIAGPTDPTLVEAGVAVIVLRRPNQTAGQVVAHAKGRRLVTEQPDDPAVRDFVEYYLAGGQGG